MFQASRVPSHIYTSRTLARPETTSSRRSKNTNSIYVLSCPNVHSTAPVTIIAPTVISVDNVFLFLEKSIMHYFFIFLPAFFMKVARTIPYSDLLPSLSDNFDGSVVADADIPLNLNIFSITANNPYPVSGTTEFTTNSDQPIASANIESSGSGSAIQQLGGLDSTQLTTTGTGPSSLDGAFEMADTDLVPDSDFEFNWNEPEWKYIFPVTLRIQICPLIPKGSLDYGTDAFMCCPPPRFNTKCIPSKSFARYCSLVISN